MDDSTTADALLALADLLALPGRIELWEFDFADIPEQPRILVRMTEGRTVVCDGLDGSSGQRAPSVQAYVTTITRQLRRDPNWALLLEDLVYGLGSLLRSSSEKMESWMRAVRLTEAVAKTTEEAAAAGDRLAQRRLALVHRARFILLNAALLVEAGPEGFRNAAPLGPTLDERARTARDDWFLDLVNHEDRPALASWAPSYMDDQLRLVARCSDGAPFTRWVVREGLLPRFMLIDAWEQAPSARPVIATSAALLAVTTVLVVAGLLGLPPVAALKLAWIPAALAYLSMALASAVDRAAGYLACLRLPAGAAVGLLAILSFGSGWVLTPGRAWLAASATLLAASWGYLLLEAIAHGAPRGRAVGRASLVTALGFAHGTAVAAIAIPLVGRAFVDDLPMHLDSLGATDTSQFLVLAASAGLAVGVFLQVLWDDRPVTYPLTHLAWRGRGRG